MFIQGGSGFPDEEPFDDNGQVDLNVNRGKMRSSGQAKSVRCLSSHMRQTTQQSKFQKAKQLLKPNMITFEETINDGTRKFSMDRGLMEEQN